MGRQSAPVNNSETWRSVVNYKKLRELQEMLMASDSDELRSRENHRSRRWFIRILSGSAFAAVVTSANHAHASCQNEDSCGPDSCTTDICSELNTCSTSNICDINTCGQVNTCSATNICNQNNSSICDAGGGDSCNVDTCVAVNNCTSNVCVVDQCTEDGCHGNTCTSLDSCQTNDSCPSNTCQNDDVDCGMFDIPWF